MIELKPLSPAAVPGALERAKHYRLLNEPGCAECICLDILAVDPGHQEALVLLLLSRTDQFDRGDPETLELARKVLPRLEREYDRAYYGGLVSERQAKHLLRQLGPRKRAVAYELFRYALEDYERAIELREAGNDEAVLRWNTCVRMIERYDLKSSDESPVGLGIE